MGAVVGDTQAPAIYETWNTLGHVRAGVVTVRASVVAGASTGHRVKPWLLAPSICRGPPSPCVRGGRQDRGWWSEKVFHLAMSGSAGFFLFNPFWDFDALASGPDARIADDKTLSALLLELDTVAGCGPRSWIRDMNEARSSDGFLLSGVEFPPGGDRLWRLSSDSPLRAASDRAPNATLSFEVAVGAPIPGSSAKLANCSLKFEGGSVKPPNEAAAATASGLGLWIRQAEGRGVFVRCPGGPALPWPLSPRGHKSDDTTTHGFYSDMDLASKRNVSLQLQPPSCVSGNPSAACHPVVLRPDSPWERGCLISSYSSVVLRDGRVEIYYSLTGGYVSKHTPQHQPCVGVTADTALVGVAYSTDGLSFTKPILGLTEFRNSTANNIVSGLGGLKLEGNSIWLDEIAPADERYQLRQTFLWILSLSDPQTHCVEQVQKRGQVHHLAATCAGRLGARAVGLWGWPSLED